MSNAILERVATGESVAVEECLRTYNGLVWSLARRFSSNPDDAEDAVQEIFIDVWRNASRFSATVASEATFIAMIARRRLIDRHRKRTRSIDAAPLVDETVAAAEDERDRTEIRDEAARVREFMDRLRPAERQVLELSAIDGLSHSQIAEKTNLPLGTVKTHSRRGLMRLRALLEGAGEAAPAAREESRDVRAGNRRAEGDDAHG